MSDMNRRGDWVFRATVASVVLSTFPIIFVRHQWPKLFTSEDIAVFAAGVTLATAITAVRAAQTSRDAAKDSLRALQLHFRPGPIRVQFHVRNPDELDLDTATDLLSDPAPLWLSVIVRQPVQSRYDFTWVDEAGQAHTRHRVTLPTRADAELQPILLEGLVGTQQVSGPSVDTLAKVPNLVVTCEDDQSRTGWSTPPIHLPEPTAFGSRELAFNLKK